MKTPAILNRFRAPYINGKAYVNDTMPKAVKKKGAEVYYWLKANDCCDEIERTNQLITDCKILRHACETHAASYLKDIKESKRAAIQAFVDTKLDAIDGYITALASMKDLSLDRDFAIEQSLLNAGEYRTNYITAQNFASFKLSLGEEDSRKFAIQHQISGPKSYLIKRM